VNVSLPKFGRTYHTHSSDNLRLFPKTVRGSEKWKLIYKRRTSIERSNKREKVDNKLESGRHRSTHMWYMRIYSIMICQHIDAWYAHQKEDWKYLKDFDLPCRLIIFFEYSKKIGFVCPFLKNGFHFPFFPVQICRFSANPPFRPHLMP
jgi:hypothetical protein